jgi:hypothetical protein
MDPPFPIPTLLPEMLSDQMNRRIPNTRDITHERMAAHLRLVRTWLAENPDAVQAVLAAAREPYAFEDVVAALLPPLITLAGVREGRGRLYARFPCD